MPIVDPVRLRQLGVPLCTKKTAAAAKAVWPTGVRAYDELVSVVDGLMKRLSGDYGLSFNVRW